MIEPAPGAEADAGAVPSVARTVTLTVPVTELDVTESIPVDESSAAHAGSAAAVEYVTEPVFPVAEIVV